MNVSSLAAPLIVIVRLSFEAGIGSRFTRQAPFASAVAVFACPANVTVTFSPASAVPHTATGRLRWKTMLSANGVAEATFASAEPTAAIAKAVKIMNFFIFVPFERRT